MFKRSIIIIENKLLKESLASDRCIISVIGDHAGETPNIVFHRKIMDIERTGRTFWLAKSRKTKYEIVHKLCKSSEVYMIFIAPSTPLGARSTKTADHARVYSEDGIIWNNFPLELSPVTGKLDRKSHALVFNALETVNDAVMDIWSYADFENAQKPLKMILGCSTVCAIRKSMKQHPERMKSRYRNIVAVAHIVSPFSVWVR